MRKVPYFYPTGGKLNKLRRYVNLAFLLVLIGIPFAVWNGASLLRFDVEQMEFHLLFTVFSFTEFHIFLLLTLAATAALIWVTQLWGRIWCGWMCPQTILTDFVRFFEKFWIPRKSIKGFEKIWRTGMSWLTMGAFFLLVSLDIVWYFISPYEFWDQLTTGTMSVFLSGSVIVTFIVIAADAGIVRQSFCEFLCPYAKMQGAFFRPSTLIISFDDTRKSDCTNCMMCSRVCPSGIDIRDGLQMACIACGACIDACEPIMAKKQKPNLVRYFSEIKTPSVLKDQATIFAAAATVLFLVSGFFIYTHENIKVTVTRNTAMVSKHVQGDLVNGYWLSVDNLGKENADISIDLASENFKFVPAAGDITIKAGETRRIPLMVASSVDHVETEFTIRVKNGKWQKEFIQGFTRDKKGI